jgi:hypothetical protein
MEIASPVKKNIWLDVIVEKMMMLWIVSKCLILVDRFVEKYWNADTILVKINAI